MSDDGSLNKELCDLKMLFSCIGLIFVFNFNDVVGDML